MRRKWSVKSVAICFALWLASLSFLYPLFYMFSNSLKSPSEYYTYPFRAFVEVVSFNNYVVMISQFRIFILFRNSFLVVFFGGILVLAFSICASYAFAKLDFWGRKTIYLAVIATMAVPVVVTLIPMYLMFSKVGLVNNLRSVIVAYVGFGIPSNILLMTSSFRGIPNPLLDTSKIDGCNYFQMILNVVIPMGRAIIVINIIFNALFMWNDLLLPIVFLQSRNVKTVMAGLASLMQKYGGEPTLQFAGLVLAALPMLIFYMFVQKFIVKGIVVGSIK